MDINDMTADELVNGDLKQLECEHCGHCRWF